MKKIYHLSTCNTNQRIIKELEGLKGFEFQNISEKNIEPEVLDSLAKKLGSYGSLFSRRAQKFKSMGLKDKDLSEQEMRSLILEEYTFLKRPVIINEDQVFVGNTKSVVNDAKLSIL